MKSKAVSIKAAFKAAFPVTLPVLTGFLVLGAAYGILMNSEGYGPLWSLLFGFIAFGGSMQFAAIPFLSGTFQPVQVFLLSLMVNARHMFYGLSMLDKYKGAGKLKNFLIYYMCDETFALNYSTQVPDGVEKKYFYFAITLLDLIYWAFSGFLGGVLGSLLVFNTTGLDFALTALFIALFIEQIKAKQSAICGAVGVLGAFLSLLLFGADNMVIPAMIIILAVLLGGRRKICA